MSTQKPSCCPGPLFWLWGVIVVGVVGVSLAVAFAAEERTGEQIYKQQCASCHGASGEGTKEFPRRLAGSKSVAQLTKLIDRTMPEDDPDRCVGDDAAKVAAYVYDAFYSEIAQARNKPPRVELARLTVRQHQQSVADLIEGFRSPPRWDDQRGLDGQYYTSRRFRGRPAVQRRDATVQFHFGEQSPAKEIPPKEYAAKWQGAVLAPETGDYEFIVRTENAFRLWVNDNTEPLIDAWVKSGKDTEFKAVVRLLGGRVYPLRLEYYKSEKEKTGSVALLWRQPHQAPEVIPARNLSPHPAPEALVLQTPFPPDDRSVGYERGTSVSKAWFAAVTDAAVETANYVARNLPELAGVQGNGPDRPARLREFAHKFAERAFRRPLTAAERQGYVDGFFAGGSDPEAAVKKVVLLVLSSPRFLYPEAGDAPEGYAVATRLSLALWDSAPDRELLAAAAAGKLKTPDEVTRQAERMAGDLRAKAKIRGFFLQWLRVEDTPDLAKDPEKFSEFTPEVATDLRTSLDLFLDDVVWGEGSDFRKLLQADYVYLNGRLAALYGADLPKDAPFTKISRDPGKYAGLLSHPYLMSTFAYTGSSSPIHRGVFLARSVLGRGLRPPPAAVAPLAPDLHPDLTTRERVSLQTQPQMCMTCHGMINSLGFTLENYDAVGRYREQEKSRPVDASGSYETPEGETVHFDGVRDLADFLAGSDEVHEAFVEQMFQHLVRQPIQAYGPRRLTELRDSFRDHGFNIRRLVVEIGAGAARSSNQ